MFASKRGLRLARWVFFGILATSMLTLPASGAPQFAPSIERVLPYMSQSVVLSYYLAHPDRAPAQLGQRLETARQASLQSQAQPALSASAAPLAGIGNRFNRDNTGLPQNEESVTACGASNTQQQAAATTVLGGTNDFRGFFTRQGNITGWHLSTDGGRTIAKEGRLPPIRIAGTNTPSQGDPVMVSTPGCTLYAGSLNFNPRGPFAGPSGVGIYRTTRNTLLACPGGTASSCWPRRRAAAVAAPGHFLDKEWVYVGRSGRSGTVVWVVYTDFAAPTTPTGPQSVSIKAVRCSADLSRCTAPITIQRVTGDLNFVQFGDVTVGPDGRTYVSWTQIRATTDGVQNFTHRLRVAAAGSTTFGPIRTVVHESRPLPFGGHLHAEDFRTATIPKSEVRIVNGRPRVYVVWDACKARPFGFVCEESQIKLRSSDNLGATWSATKVISAGGDNYFPTISSDKSGSRIAVAYFTNRFDRIFHNRQDIELVTLNPTTRAVARRQRLTAVSNESEADPLLGGSFIGDYIEVFARAGTAYVHYNANYRSLRLIGQGLAIPQQDNYLVKGRL